MGAEISGTEDRRRRMLAARDVGGECVSRQTGSGAAPPGSPKARARDERRAGRAPAVRDRIKGAPIVGSPTAGAPIVSAPGGRAPRLILVVLLFLLVCGVVLAAGYPATRGSFYLDSFSYFTSLPELGSRSLSWQKLYDVTFHNPFPAGKRFLPNLTFVLENSLIGLTPVTGRIVNLAIHSVNILLVFLLASQILGLLDRGGRSRSAIAAFAALLWGLDPFWGDAVYYVVQRMALLATTFYLAAVLCYLRARAASGSRRRTWAVLTFLSLGICLTCKENALLFPLGIAVLESVLPRERSWVFSRRPGLLLLATVALLVLAPLVAWFVGYGAVLRDLLTPQGREFTLGQRVLTEGRVLLHYLSHLLLPLPRSLSFVLKFPLSRSLVQPPATLLSWAVILGLLSLALWKRARWPLFSLAVLWFFAHHLLESTVIPLEIAFVHRSYLPAVFLFLPVADGLGKLARAWRPRPVWAAGLAVLVLFATGLRARARVWGNPEAFWAEAIEKAPGSLLGYINLGVLQTTRGQPAEAFEIYQRAMDDAYEERELLWSDLYCDAAIALTDLSRFPEAERYIAKAIEISPKITYLIHAAHIEIRAGKPERAKAVLELAERSDPEWPDLHLLKARVYVAEKDLTRAQEELKEELRLYPNNPRARALWASLAGR